MGTNTRGHFAADGHFAAGSSGDVGVVIGCRGALASCEQSPRTPTVAYSFGEAERVNWS